MSRQGKLFIVSGPSGVGKGTVIHRLKQLKPELEYSISATTRSPRSGEENGVDYYFVSQQKFKSMRENDEFLEWAQVHNNYYGTPKKEVTKRLDVGKNVILEIDIQGARQVKESFPAAVLIFLSPPSIEELEKRLDKRNSEDKQAKLTRLKNARQELQEMDCYDYQVVNNKLEQTVQKVIEIIDNESIKE